MSIFFTRYKPRGLLAMASDFSGSSDEELDHYTTTNVLLGYTSKDPTDDPFNQLGGSQ